MNSVSNKPKGDGFYGWLSIILPLTALALLISMFCFFVILANYAESEIWGGFICLIIGGLISSVLIIIGLGFALIAIKTAQNYWLRWSGLILNLALLGLVLYWLSPLLSQFLGL